MVDTDNILNKINWIKYHNIIEHKFWYYISRYKKLNEEFIEEFKNKVDWSQISQYQILSENFINKYIDKIDWYKLCCNNNIPEHILFRFEKYLDFTGVSSRKKLSDKLIEKYSDKLNWKEISHNIEKLSLNEREIFVRKYQNKIWWNFLHCVKFSPEFEEEFKNKLHL